jgi:hypothetical protein
MAIDKIFTTTYKGSRVGDLWTVDIYDMAAISALDTPEEITLSDAGAIVRWAADREIHEPIIASELTMEVISQGNFQIWAETTLPFTQEYRFHIVVQLNGDAWWRGMILSDRVEHPDLYQRYAYTIRAICGLGRLKTLPVTDDFTRLGRVAMLREIGVLIGAATGAGAALFGPADYYLGTNYAWFEENMPLTGPGNGDPLRYIHWQNNGVAFKVNDYGEREWMSYYDYLRILGLNFGFCITMSGGCWRIFQPNQLDGSGTTTRWFYYAYPLSPGIDGSGSISVIGANIQEDVKIESFVDVKPLRATNNTYAPGIKEISFTTPFVKNTMVLRRPYISNMSTTQTGAIGYVTGLGLEVFGYADITVDPNLVPFDGAYIVGKMVMTNDDGVTTYYLGNNMLWFASTPASVVLGQSGVFFQGDVTGGLPVPFSYSRFTTQVPVIGDVEASITYTMYDAATNLEIASGVLDQKDDFTARTYEISSNKPNNYEIKQTNTLTTQSSSVTIDLGQLPLIDRPTGNIYNAIGIWTGLAAVNSTGWRRGGSGTYVPISTLLLREIMVIRQVPRHRKEGGYIGRSEVYYKLVQFALPYTFVSGEFQTGFDTWTRLMTQEVPPLTFDSLPVDDDIIRGELSTGTPGGTRRPRPGDIPVGVGGITLEPIAAGGTTTITTTDPIPTGLTSGTEVWIIDASSGYSLKVILGADADAGDTVLTIEEVDIAGDLIDPVLALDQKTLLTVAGGGVDTFIGLTDTPSSYTGQAGNVPTVNTGETALEFLPRGDSWFWGTTALAPSNSLGNDGDEWVVNGGRIYEKISGSWVLKDLRLVGGGDLGTNLTASTYSVILRNDVTFGAVTGTTIGGFLSYVYNSVEFSGTTGVNQLLAANQVRPIVYVNYTGNSTIRFPASGVGNNNNLIVISNINTGTCTIERAVSDSATTINGATTYTLLPGQSVALQYIHASTDWRILWKDSETQRLFWSANNPTYADNAAAVAAGLAVGVGYQTSTGEQRIVV